MPKQRTIEVADQRVLTARLRWLALRAPDLARDVRAGQFMMLRCAEPGAFDPLLRRALFVAAAEPALGQIGLLYAPEEDRGLAWLARARPGDTLDLLGPFGRPFSLEPRTRALLLFGEGVGLAPLLLLAREALARGGSVTLLAGASSAELLPPPALLPPDLEYQTTIGDVTDLLAQEAGRATIRWADQICAALPQERLARLRDAVLAGRVRTGRGLVSVLLACALPCGIGTCGVCALELRRGLRLACIDGPVFDLRDAIASV